MLYDITNIKERPSNISIKTESVAKPFINYSIPSTDSTVNNQYMQNNGNNVQKHYSIGGQIGLQNAINSDSRFQKLGNNLNKAQAMARSGFDNEYIRQNTNWFQDKNGDWKFEFSDKDMSLKPNIKLKENTTYKLKDILEHDLLFAIYPELANYEVEFENLGNVVGKFNRTTNQIKINNNKIGSKFSIEKTLVHELQHAIQKIEGFEQGKSSKFSKLAYFNSLGEIEASDTANRFVYDKSNNLDRELIAPETSKINPKHRSLNNYLENRKITDKIKDGIYKFFKLGGADNAESIETNLENDLQKNSEINGRNKRIGGYGREYIEGLENSSSFSLNQNNPSWSNYLKEYWDLMPNSTKTFGLPTAENLKAFDKEQSKKAYESLHMKNESENLE